MNTDPLTFWTQLIAGIVVVICLVAIVAVALRCKRRTGAYPPELTGKLDEPGWFSFVPFVWLILRTEMTPAWLFQTFPLYILLTGLDIAFAMGFLAYAGFSFSHVFRPRWNRSNGLWVVYSLIFPVVFAWPLAEDIRHLAEMPWVWIIAGVLGMGLSPFIARLAYHEFYVRRSARSGAGELH